MAGHVPTRWLRIDELVKDIFQRNGAMAQRRKALSPFIFRTLKLRP
jgi:hypothetical protein